jgi:glutathione synthase
MAYLFVVDPISKIQPKFDTSLRLAKEALCRGISVYWADVTTIEGSSVMTGDFSSIPCQKVVGIFPEQAKFIDLESPTTKSVDYFKVLFQRRDPPVDKAFIKFSQAWAKVPKSVLQINDPATCWKVPEHWLQMEFPKFAIPTKEVKNLKDFVKAVRSQKGETVSKPERECSGIGIQFFKPDTEESILETYWKEFGPTLILQPYREEITKSGDLRVLVMNGKIMGQVLRVPRQGSRLANLHQGATWRAWDLTPKQNEASQIVGQKLAQRGLWLVGVDFIGDEISEINVTSPSAMVQINDVMNQKTEVAIINEVESLSFQKRQKQS